MHCSAEDGALDAVEELLMYDFALGERGRRVTLHTMVAALRGDPRTPWRDIFGDGVKGSPPSGQRLLELGWLCARLLAGDTLPEVLLEVGRYAYAAFEGIERTALAGALFLLAPGHSGAQLEVARWMSRPTAEEGLENSPPSMLRAEALHNYAIHLDPAGHEEEAGRIWADAYTQYLGACLPANGTIVGAQAQHFRVDCRREDLAEAVERGDPLPDELPPVTNPNAANRPVPDEFVEGGIEGLLGGWPASRD